MPQLFWQVLKTQKWGEPVTSHFNSQLLRLRKHYEKYRVIRLTGVQLIAFQWVGRAVSEMKNHMNVQDLVLPPCCHTIKAEAFHTLVLYMYQYKFM